MVRRSAKQLDTGISSLRARSESDAARCISEKASNRSRTRPAVFTSIKEVYTLVKTQVKAYRYGLPRKVFESRRSPMKQKRYFVRKADVKAYSPANHAETLNRRLIGPETVGAHHPKGRVGTERAEG